MLIRTLQALAEDDLLRPAHARAERICVAAWSAPRDHQLEQVGRGARVLLDLRARGGGAVPVFVGLAGRAPLLVGGGGGVVVEGEAEGAEHGAGRSRLCQSRLRTRFG